MKRIRYRILLVAVLNLLSFECWTQLAVNWRESSGEKALTYQMIFLAVASIWAIWPAFANRTLRIVYRGVLACVLFVGFFALMGVYSWHVRPNLGLYREPGWVSQHPGFQAELRARIQRNRWW